MTKTRDLSDFLIEGGIDPPSQIPHIDPGVLQPAVAGKDLSGTALGGSYVYGTAHTDGHKYYYTDIKGSKPIKDPRIGGHFGSQRHKLKSIQLLEQETATEGFNVYSVDGREWIRAVSKNTGWTITNDSSGNFLNAPTDNTGSFIEITGYFNDINFSLATHSNRCDDIDITVNGTLSVDGSSTLGGKTSVGTPLGSRYVDYGSVINGGSTLSTSLGTTPRINTLKYELKTASSEYVELFAIELIAQDTTSTANRSKIQIPSQNVVSYGKKFTVSGTPHYNPFAQSQTGADVTINSSTTNTAKLADGWSGTGATYYSSELDTATSLGLSAWESGGDFYRPVNGGRVVWWVNSSGDLKCSVNMIPPAGTAIGGVTGGHNVPTGTHNWATKNQPALHSTTIDHSQAEIAKTFHFREFGNGGANAGTLGGSYADASMLNAEDDVTYVMDDGVTALTCNDAAITGTSLYTENTGERFITFIGTGISVNMKHSATGNANDDHRVYIDGVEIKEWDGTSNTTSNHIVHYAQNLPYGTHILTIDRLAATSSVPADNEYTFYQPKKPPIPEGACVIADYMLMADFVAQSAAGTKNISKGVRAVAASRDQFYDGASAFSVSLDARLPFGYKLTSANAGGQTIKLPFFGTDFLVQHYDNRVGTLSNGLGTNGTSANISTSGFDGLTKHTGLTLGLNSAQNHQADGQNADEMWTAYTHVATPIHTSSHYQTFETPFLYELIGGDRNMEQTNLVVSPDGKTWDEVTRDVSYIGNQCISTAPGTAEGGAPNISANTHPKIHTRWRGTEVKTSAWRIKTWLNKDFAIAYNHVICLKNGLYRITFSQRYNTSVDSAGSTGVVLNQVSWNGTADSGVASHLLWGYHNDEEDLRTLTGSFHLKRGDQISFQGPSLDLRGEIVQIDRIS